MRTIKSKNISIMRLLLSTVVRLLIGLIVFSLQCQKPNLMSTDLIVPNWQDGDKYYYSIYHHNQLIGYVRQLLHFDMEGNKPIYVIESVSDFSFSEDYLVDSTVVSFCRKDFVPFWSYRRVETDFDTRIVEAHYDGSNIDIWTETMDGKNATTVSVKVRYFDHAMIFHLSRCLKFDKTKRYSISIFNPFLLQLTDCEIKYIGKKSVTTQLGTFDCDKISLSFDSKKYLIFVERTGLRRIIQFQEKNSNLLMVLTEKPQT